MSEFDGWKKNNCFSDEPEWLEAVEYGFNGAWNHQQKKIDEMKLTLDRSLDVLSSVDGHGDLTDLTNKIQELLK